MRHVFLCQRGNFFSRISKIIAARPDYLEIIAASPQDYLDIIAAPMNYLEIIAARPNYLTARPNYLEIIAAPVWLVCQNTVRFALICKFREECAKVLGTHKARSADNEERARKNAENRRFNRRDRRRLSR